MENETYVEEEIGEIGGRKKKKRKRRKK